MKSAPAPTRARPPAAARRPAPARPPAGVGRARRGVPCGGRQAGAHKAYGFTAHRAPGGRARVQTRRFFTEARAPASRGGAPVAYLKNGSASGEGVYTISRAGTERAKGHSRHDEREALPHPVLGRVMHGHTSNALRQRLRQDHRIARRESDRRDDVDVAGRCLGRVPGWGYGRVRARARVRARVRVTVDLETAYSHPNPSPRQRTRIRVTVDVEAA